jgi:signal transduction histidine kinase
VSGKKQTGQTNTRTSGQPDIENNITQCGKLTGGIAHDLNTILTTIYGYCEFALESLDESSEAGQSIRRIIQASDRARTLTGRLMNLSLHSEDEKTNIRVSDIISETVSFIKPSIPHKTEVVSNITSPDIEVRSDPTQLFRVLINLAVNALQAMESTGGRLTITLEAVHTDNNGHLPSGEYALIRFADTGHGMDAETASRVFEPFFTSGKKGKGTGIGLSTVRDIISDLGGDVNITSLLNEGTVIDVLIPAVAGQEQSMTD